MGHPELYDKNQIRDETLSGFFVPIRDAFLREILEECPFLLMDPMQSNLENASDKEHNMSEKKGN